MKPIAVIIIIALCGCDKDKPADKPGVAKPATSPSKTEPATATPTPPPTLTKPLIAKKAPADGDAKPTIPKPAADGTAAEPTKPTTIVGDFPVKGTLSKSLEVSLAKASVVVSATAKAKGIAVRAGKQRLASCKRGKEPMRVEAIGDDPHLILLCLTLDAAGKPTKTDGWRFEWKSKKFVPSGSFEGDGRVDYQTIEFDEE